MTSRYEILKNQTQLIIHHYHQMELADWQSQPDLKVNMSNG
nr:hypothetical protein [Shewanella putrefaciens]